MKKNKERFIGNGVTQENDVTQANNVKQENVKQENNLRQTLRMSNNKFAENGDEQFMEKNERFSDDRQKSEKKRVLLTYIESGLGHITSIASIADNLKKYYGDQFEFVESHIMDEDGDKNLINWEKFIIKQTKNTNRIPFFGKFIFGFLNFMGKVKFMRFLHRTVFASHTRHLMRAFEKRRPDVIVSTHYFITFAALEYQKKVDPNCRVVTYNPDNNVHVWWDNREHLFLVNNRAAYEEAVGVRKFNPACVKQVFFIARDQILNANLTRQEYREKLNLPQNKFCVVVADGMYACAKAKKVTRELLKTKIPLTIVLVAGKNEKLRKKFEELQNSGRISESGKFSDNITFVVLPFMKNVYEYYKAADVFVTKAGPNAVLDSVFMGTPVLIDYYAHPIEKATTKLFVDRLQCGKAVFGAKKIRRQIENWAQDPNERAKLLQFQENCKAVDKFKNGGSDAARYIFDDAFCDNVTNFASPYQNCLYTLAKQGKLNELTTPFNLANQKTDVDYNKILHTNFGQKLLHAIVKVVVGTLGPIFNFFVFHLRVKGRKNLKGVKSAIVVSNHVSYVDCLLNFQVLRGKRVFITAAPHNWKKGFGGAILKAGGVVPMPATYSQNKQFVSAVGEMLQRPAVVQFCPEQSLWLHYTQSRPFKKGAFLYAAENGVPVVPVIYCFRKGWLRKKRKNVTAFVGKPIQADKNLPKAEAAAYLQRRAQEFYDNTVIDFYGYDKQTYDQTKINPEHNEKEIRKKKRKIKKKF